MIKSKVYLCLFVFLLASLSCEQGEQHGNKEQFSSTDPLQNNARAEQPDLVPRQDVSTSRSQLQPNECDLPLILLYHEEKNFQKDSQTYLYKLPDGQLDIDPTTGKSISGVLSLGTYQGGHDHSNGNNRVVYQNSIYELSNANYRDLYIFYQGMCRRGFQDKDWGKFQTMLKRYEKSSQLGGRTQKNSFNTVQQRTKDGFQILLKDRQRLVFTYGHNSHSAAQLQIQINFKKDGQWHHWHRDDILYNLPNEGEMTLDLQQVGFQFLPDVWDVEVYLLESGRTTYKVHSSD